MGSTEDHDRLALFTQWKDPYINACDKLCELIEKPAR